MKRAVTWSLCVATAFVSLLLFTATGCHPTPDEREGEPGYHADEMPLLSAATLGEGEGLQVVATTNIVADVVQSVGGDLIHLTTLMPVGTDPHTFEPTPQDVAAVADAHVVFVNGAGLEIFLEPLLESAGEDVPVVPVSYGIELLEFEGAHGDEREEERHRGQFDPHTWFDPHSVIAWTHNIERALIALDPDNAETYEANAEAYEVELETLDGWIREQLAQVPPENRKLVTDHTSLGYFARQYGFEQIGAVFPGYSTLAEPAARDIANLEDAIREFDVRAIFVGLTVNPELAQRVADDTGTRLVFLYTGSLSEPGGPADDYLAFMRYNVAAMVEVLR